MVDGRKRDIHLEALNTDTFVRCLFCGVSTPVQRTSESHYVKGVELSHLLLTVRPHTFSRPLKSTTGKQILYHRDYLEAIYKNPAINCQQSSHNPLFIQHLSIPVCLVLTICAPPIGIMSDWCRDLMLGYRTRLRILALIIHGMVGRHIRDRGSP